MSNTVPIKAAIDEIVSLLGSYMSGRAASTQTEQPKLDYKTMQQGESVMNIIRTGVSQYGSEAGKAKLARFEHNPKVAVDLQQVLADIAERYPVFLQQLTSFAEQREKDRLG